jgi:hypothetical protein
MIRKGAVVIASIIVALAVTVGLYASGMDDQLTMYSSSSSISSSSSTGGVNSDIVEVVIESDVGWSADIKDSESKSHSVDGFGDRTIPITCKSEGTYSITIQKTDGRSGTLNVEIVRDGTDGSSSSQSSRSTSASGIISLSGTC